MNFAFQADLEFTLKSPQFSRKRAINDCLILPEFDQHLSMV